LAVAALMMYCQTPKLKPCRIAFNDGVVLGKVSPQAFIHRALDA